MGALMPTLVHMAVCREVVIDQATNVVSIHGLIEEAQVPPEAFAMAKEQKVMAASPMAVYALLSWEWPTAEEHAPLDLELRMSNPAGETTVLASLRKEPDPAARLRTIFNLPGFPLDGEGNYTFELFSGKKLLGKVPFRVIPLTVAVGELAQAQIND